MLNKILVPFLLQVRSWCPLCASRTATLLLPPLPPYQHHVEFVQRPTFCTYGPQGFGFAASCRALALLRCGTGGSYPHSLARGYTSGWLGCILTDQGGRTLTPWPGVGQCMPRGVAPSLPGTCGWHWGVEPSLPVHIAALQVKNRGKHPRKWKNWYKYFYKMIIKIGQVQLGKTALTAEEKENLQTLFPNFLTVFLIKHPSPALILSIMAQYLLYGCLLP